MANFIHFENSHVFSKAPVQENMPASESVNKSVHTVQAEEIWANKCPFITYNEVKDLTADKTFDSFEGYAPVKFNYKKQVIVLTDINNNGKDSNGLAGKVFIEGKPINQFISETDATDKNGALAFGYRPILFDKDGGAVPSDNYTVNCSNGIIYFTNPVTSTAENCNYFLSFFTYEGAKLDTTITNIKSSINETKDDLSSHASDTDVHITTSERSKWNTAASKAGTAIQTVKRTNNSSTLINVDQSETSVSITLSDTIATKDELSLHTSDTDIHITADERSQLSLDEKLIFDSEKNVLSLSQGAYYGIRYIPSETFKFNKISIIRDENESVIGSKYLFIFKEENNTKVFVQKCSTRPGSTIVDNVCTWEFEPTLLEKDGKYFIIFKDDESEIYSKSAVRLKALKQNSTNESLYFINDNDQGASTSFVPNIKIYGKGIGVKKYIDNHTIYNGVNSNNWNIIQDGSSAFTTSLEDLSSSMPSLTVATGMFEGNTAITEFNIKVPNLVIADNMFSGCTNLTTIDSSFQNVVSATNMFENCPLTSITLTYPGFANLSEAATYTNETTKEKGLFDSAKETLVTLKASMPSLTKGTQLFKDFTALESYNGNLNQLEDGNAMFRGCSSMTSFSGDLSSLSNGRWMFGNSSLSSWDNDMPKLKDGYAMYYNVPLKYFNGSLAALEDGSYMFDGCSKLEDFSSDLTSLTNGYQMFSRNGLINFTTTSLRSLENAEGMFRANSGSVSPLKNFTVKDNDMSKVTNAPWMFQGCGNLVEFDCDLSSLETGTAMFQGCTSLKTVETWLPVLTTGGLMFGGCSSLTGFDIELPNLEDGGAMFQGCVNISEFDIELPKLKKGSAMFEGCSNLTEFTKDLSVLETGDKMFGKTTSLTTFEGDLSSMTNGYKMFYGVIDQQTGTETTSSITTFNSNLNSLENGHYMFYLARELDSLNIDNNNVDSISSLKFGKNMFTGCESLTEFRYNLPNLGSYDVWVETNEPLANGTYREYAKADAAKEMFSGCTALTTFESDLSSLTDHGNMFSGCTSLRTVNANMSSLTNGSSLFSGLTSLQSFIGDFSSLTDTNNMFNSCRSLRIFEADLTSLTSGDGLFSGLALERFIGNVYSLTSGARMFNGCKLDKDSVLGIINCLKTTNTCANAANLTLGINASLRNDSDILTALGISSAEESPASLTGHGGGTWTVTLQWNS